MKGIKFLPYVIDGNVINKRFISDQSHGLLTQAVTSQLVSVMSTPLAMDTKINLLSKDLIGASSAGDVLAPDVKLAAIYIKLTSELGAGIVRVDMSVLPNTTFCSMAEGGGSQRLLDRRGMGDIVIDPYGEDVYGEHLRIVRPGERNETYALDIDILGELDLQFAWVELKDVCRREKVVYFNDIQINYEVIGFDLDAYILTVDESGEVIEPTIKESFKNIVKQIGKSLSGKFNK